MPSQTNQATMAVIAPPEGFCSKFQLDSCVGVTGINGVSKVGGRTDGHAENAINARTDTLEILKHVSDVWHEPYRSIPTVIRACIRCPDDAWHNARNYTLILPLFGDSNVFLPKA